MYENRRFAFWLISLLITSILSLPAAAQVDRAAINGTVTDSTGAVVQGAKVVLLSAATGLRRETATNAAGIYDFSAVPIGAYKIDISKDGFKSVEIPNFELAVGQPRTIDVHLEVGAISNSVEVTTSV